MKWVVRNRKWLFSGIGVFLLSGLLRIAFQSTDSPSPTRSDPVNVPGVVEAEHAKSNEVSRDGAGTKVLLADYTKLFDGYLYYFVNSLKPDSVEHVIGDNLVKDMVASTVSVDGHGEIHLSVNPWNYASLFRDQLSFFEFREAVPPPDDREEWEYGKSPIDERYYQIRGQIEANLRSYFSDRRRLESFYRAKKHLIRETLKETIPIALRTRFVGEFDRVIESFQVVLDPGYRRIFEDYLEAERRYIGERYGYVSEEEMGNFQGTYNDHKGPIGSIYPNYAKTLQEKSSAHDQEEDLAEVRKILFSRSPNAKAAAFAYRRYLEGGEELVEGYIAILKDLRPSVFAN